jgi:hypothetical protein
MEPLQIQATTDTPKVTCDLDGTITLIGKSLNEDPFDFYSPILNWVNEVQAENLTIDFQLEYTNTSSSKQIYNLLKFAKENKWKKSILVKWYYNENDEDGYELGKEFESMLDIPFEFHALS